MKDRLDDGSNTMAYHGVLASKMHHFVRFCPIETERFPHGIGFKQACTKEQVDQFKTDIDEYIDQALPTIMKNYADRHGRQALLSIVYTLPNWRTPNAESRDLSCQDA